jgi:KipI family sensor histidine kinase inhibitor
MMAQDGQSGFPKRANLGLSARLVSFGDVLTEPANRAALAFRAAVDREGWDGIIETTTSLTSVYIGFDPMLADHANVSARLDALLASADWYAADFPEGRIHWTLPAVFGGSLAPQLDEAARLADVTPEQAVKDLTAQPVRVLTIGYAPGQPYLGTLPSNWDIPRQTEISAKVPPGALVVAIRQFVLFATEAPTGWRHIAQTAFPCFRPDSDSPFTLRPGDEIQFTAIDESTFAQVQSAPLGGATKRSIR